MIGDNVYEQFTDCLLFTVQVHRKFGIGNSSVDWWWLERIDSWKELFLWL